MAITIQSESKKIITLPEYQEYVKTNVVAKDKDSILESSSMLKALSNNKNFLAEIINSELKDLNQFQKSNLYTAQTILLGGGDDFLIRANVWLPPCKSQRLKAIEDKVYSYLLPHDHNFDFLTIGHFGPGYETSIYEYDYADTIGKPGEEVDLKLLEHTRLDEGKMMFYRSGKDVHTQFHPDDLSISLNLLLIPDQVTIQDQYYFDTDKKIISGYVEANVETRNLLLKLAGLIGNDETRNHLEFIAQKHPARRNRIQAYDSLAKLCPDDHEQIWKRALLDNETLVKIRAKQEMTQLESTHA